MVKATKMDYWRVEFLGMVIINNSWLDFQAWNGKMLPCPPDFTER